MHEVMYQMNYRKVLFILASILSFIAGAYCLSILLVSCAGHPPNTQLGFFVVPVSALCAGLFSVLGFNLLKQRHKDEVKYENNKKQISILAICSLLLSSIGMLIPPVSIGGIVAGHISRSKCKKNTNMSGSGLALFGIILGYISVIYFSYVFITVYMVAQNNT
jgi:hypothetical protein